MLLAVLVATSIRLAGSTIQVAGQVPNAPKEPEPEFLQPLENQTISQGRDVHFTCIVDHLGPYKVAWIKSDTKAILAIHTHLVAHNQRLSVTHNGHNTWRLHVSKVQLSDNGTYMCQINTEPMRSQMGYLVVVVPPDILNNDTTETSSVAREGGSVRLKCTAVAVPRPTVTWRREDSTAIVFRHEGGREKQTVRNHEGPVLQLSHVTRQDMGTYLCIASNGVPPSVSKRFQVQVHFEPQIKVANQLVAAPVYSDVVIQCYVEASPKAMNTWWRESTGGSKDDKLVQGDKYVMQEIPFSEYAVLMNLTIRNLSKKDFGGYICSSVNVLGKTEGNVRLQELHLPVAPPVTSSTPAPPRHAHDPGKHRNRNKKPPAHSKEAQQPGKPSSSGGPGANDWRKKRPDDPDGAADDTSAMTSSSEQRNTAATSSWPGASAAASTRSPLWRREGGRRGGAAGVRGSGAAGIVGLVAVLQGLGALLGSRRW